MKPEIKLYNTLSRQAERFEPMDAAHVKLYVCGPTVYDEAHLGHARCYITWDILYRFLTFMGYTVNYTRNVTDVDDKILNRARDNGEDPLALAQRFTQRFHHVMARLNVLPPTHEPKATEYAPRMVDMIAALVEKGMAYPTPSGSVYYRTSRKANYGNLCHQNLEDLQSGARVDIDPEKENPLDFALWKGATEGEPLVWPSPWGYGRPGWHIECSTMSYQILGEQLDIHAGGMDLIFPHHQNEIAQSEAFTGKEPFVKLWMHNGFVNVSGEKMSKSLGNFSTIEKLLARYDANTIRYFILTHHYRSPVDFSDEAMTGAENRVRKMTQNVTQLLKDMQASPAKLTQPVERRVKELLAQPELCGNALAEWERAALGFLAAMQDDMNTAQALAALNDLLTQANPKPGETIQQPEPDALTPLGAFLLLSDLLGFDFLQAQAGPDMQFAKDALRRMLLDLDPNANMVDIDGNPEQMVEAILALRVQARQNKNWPLSDQIRDQLASLGIIVKDRKDAPAAWHYEPIATTTAP